MSELKNRLRSQYWKVILALILVTGVCSAPIYYHRIAVPVDTDYGSHVMFAQQILQAENGEGPKLSHPILQYILIGMHLASGRILGLYASLMVLQVLVQVLIALIIYFWIGPAERKHWDWLRAGIAVSLTFIAPIMLLVFRDGFFYYGYIGLANYHNPTIHLLKPFALLSFIFATRSISGQKSNWKQVALAAALIILAAWTKPNYALSILPALGLIALLRMFQRKPLDWKLLLGGFFIPGVVTLLIQWLIAFDANNPGGSILLAPFQVEGAYSDYLLVKFFLSTLLPISVLLIARSQVIRDEHLLLGWIGFLVGAAQFYLLAEGGDRMEHGNFRWSAQIMLFLLFVVSVRWFLQEKLARGPVRWIEKAAAYAAYLAHLAGGVAYYIYCLISIHYR